MASLAVDRLGGSTFFVLAGQVAVAAGFVGMSGIVIKLFQIAAAYGGFAEAAGPGVQRGQSLVEPQVAGSLGQRGHQRSQCLGRHVVGNEKFGVGQRGPHCQGNIVSIALVDKRRGGFEFLHQYRAFFGRDESRTRRRAAQLGQNLLIVASVQLVLRLHLSKLQIVIASFLEISRLHDGMRQQFVEFGNVSRVAGLLRKIEQDLQRGHILAHMADQRMQAFENFA